MNQSNCNLYVSAIDNEDIKEIEELSRRIIKSNKDDVIFEMYNKELLTADRLDFIMKNCTKYLNISSNLIKCLLRNREVNLLDIIFSHYKFYDNEFIVELLLYYKKKTPISTSNLHEIISIEKYKILTNSGKYLINEFNKKYINIHIVKYLVENESDINDYNKDGETPLFYACKNGNETLVKYLVERGADINKENKYGYTPLFYACKNGIETLVKYLVEHEADINKENKYGNTPLFYACKSGNQALVKYLVEQGANINKENKYGYTPLFYGCENGNETLVKYLVEQGVDINKESKYGYTPIFYACKNGNETLVKYLVEQGADINKENEDGETPL